MQAWFADVTEGLGHRHGDESFDDYARQPLLPMALSQLGPGVAWHDVDGDGWEDLAIGGGRGSRFAVLKNLQNPQASGRVRTLSPERKPRHKESTQAR